MPNKYRPSNGTEGAAFFEAWCFHCVRDKHFSEGKDFDACAPEEICPIIGDTFAYKVDDPKYPVEWIIEAGVPKCTAFTPITDPVRVPRCTKTPDMFGEPKS